MFWKQYAKNLASIAAGVCVIALLVAGGNIIAHTLGDVYLLAAIGIAAALAGTYIVTVDDLAPRDSNDGGPR